MKIPLSFGSIFSKITKKIILLIVIVSAATLLISTLVAILLSGSHNLRFPSLGTIRVTGVEAYGGDINTTQDGMQFIDWGTIYPGVLLNRSLYIKSKSSTPITLNLTLSNLTFSNSIEENVTENLPSKNPMNLTWNYNNTQLSPNEEIYITLTLKASSDPGFIEYLIAYDVKNFGFDTVITALEQQ